MVRGTIRPTVAKVDPITSPQWRELVHGMPSTVFHSPQWMKAIQDTYGVEFSACILEQDGRAVAGIPWTDSNDILGRRRVTLAFSDFCDPLAVDRADAGLLARQLASQEQPWTLRALARNLPTLSAPASRPVLFKWQGIDISPDTQALWDRLTTMARRGVQKAERSGVHVRPAQDRADLRAWYLLHLRLRKSKHGLLAQPYAFFEHIWDEFVERDNGFLLLAFEGARVIGGTFYLVWKDTCYYKFNASDLDSLALRPNNILLWQGILEAKERGLRLLDLGRSKAEQDGLIAFKAGFGAFEEDLCAITYYPDALGNGPQAEARHLLSELTHLLVRESVPDDVTEEAGALLYRFFT